MRRCIVALALCLAPSAFAAQCGSVIIRSAADADALRKGCSTVDGSITFSTSLNESVSLDGIQVITGNFTENCDWVTGQSYDASGVNLMSSTLTTVHGDFMLGECVPGLTNMSFPNLKTVGGGFDIVNFEYLTHLDITNLESVGYFRLYAATLTTMLHNELRNVTGAHGTKHVWLEQTSLASVDSLFRYPIDIGDSSAIVEVNHLAWQQTLTNLTFGFAQAGALSIKGLGALYVTLGGPETTNMAITNLTFEGSVAGLTRNAKLANLTIESVALNGGNYFEDLLLPVDSMTNLAVFHELLTRLELPPQAINYTNFSLTITDCFNLNLSSQFTTNADGTTRQTWYWPQKDMNDIVLQGNIATPFFQTWLDYEGNFTNASGRPVIKNLVLAPNGFDQLSCAPFVKLFKEGVIKTEITPCSLADSYLVFTPATWRLALIAAGFHFLLLL